MSFNDKLQNIQQQTRIGHVAFNECEVLREVIILFKTFFIFYEKLSYSIKLTTRKIFFEFKKITALFDRVVKQLIFSF